MAARRVSQLFSTSSSPKDHTYTGTLITSLMEMVDSVMQRNSSPAPDPAQEPDIEVERRLRTAGPLTTDKVLEGVRRRRVG